MEHEVAVFSVDVSLKKSFWDIKTQISDEAMSVIGQKSEDGILENKKYAQQPNHIGRNFFFAEPSQLS